MIENFFNISDLSREQIFKILKKEEDAKILKNKNIGLLFEKYSTRTRLSFAVGISSLGGNGVDIRFEELNISRDESFEDTFRAMDCYLDGLIYRTDDHQKFIQASSYFKKPIINALSDQSHPCQIISDLLTLQEHFGSLNCHILWMGDINNVCFSLFGDDKIAMMSNFSVGQDVEVSFNLSSREYNGKWYHNIDAWKIGAQGAGAPAGAVPPPSVADAPGDSADSDDLPF